MNISNIINLFFPNICLACNNILMGKDTILCTRCKHELPFTYQHLYRENESFKKFYGRLPIENCSSMLFFTKKGFVQKLFHELKYKNHPEVSYYLGKLYAKQLQETKLMKTIDIIIPVPIHTRKLVERGYNQVSGFAKALSESFNIDIEDKILIQNIYKTSQTKKNIFDRTSQKKELFDIRFNSSHFGKHYLILDDILTTGGTLEYCGKKILQIPNSRISLLCLAQTI